MVKWDWNIAISIIVLVFIIATFFFIDLPSKEDSKNMQKEITNLSSTFSTEIGTLKDEINELKEQDRANSYALINATNSLAPKKNSLKSTFYYESNMSTDSLNLMCGWSFVKCLKSEEIEKSGGIGNGTYSYSRIEIINDEGIIQKDVRLSINCDKDTLFLEGITYPPAKVVDFSTIAGFRWEFKFEEIYPQSKIVVNFPYVLYKDQGTCNIEYYSSSSDKYTEIYSIHKDSIQRVY